MRFYFLALWVAFLATILLFDTGMSDLCHRKKGVCKRAGTTCMGVTRPNECRYLSYNCCSPPMRGKRRKRSAVNSKRNPEK